MQEKPVFYIVPQFPHNPAAFLPVNRLMHGCKRTNFSTELVHPTLRIRVQADLCPLADCGGLVVINKCLVLLSCVFAAIPAFFAQHVALHPSPGFDSGEQEIIRQIVDMERQAKEASLRRDADFSLRTLAEDYVAITPLGQVTTKQETISARQRPAPL